MLPCFLNIFLISHMIYFMFIYTQYTNRPSTLQNNQSDCSKNDSQWFSDLSLLPWQIRNHSTLWLMLCKAYPCGCKKPTLIVGRRRDTNHKHSVQHNCKRLLVRKMSILCMSTINAPFFPGIYRIQTLKAQCAESTHDIVPKYVALMFEIDLNVPTKQK